MERTEFQKKKKKILKIIAIVLTSLLLIASIIAIVYIRFGIAGLLQNPVAKSLFGIDRQQNLNVPSIAAQEKKSLSQILGYDIETVDREDLTSSRSLDMTLSPQEATYLMNALLRDKKSLENLQISATADGELEVSAVADVELVCEMFGEDKETVESSVGPLPEKVTIYAAVLPQTVSETSSIESFKIGQLEIPKNIYSGLSGYVDQGVDMLFTSAFGIDLDDLSVKDGKITVSGKFPAPKP